MEHAHVRDGLKKEGVPQPLLSYQEALEALLPQVPSRVPVRTPLLSSLGKVLADSVSADRDLPPFDKSFMDGYAVRSQDAVSAPVQLKVVGIVAAGSSSLPTVGEGEAAQIMTGAPMPPGSDAVQMVEKTRAVDGVLVELTEAVCPGQNVSFRGTEVKCGDVVLPGGRSVGAADIGVLATFGRTEVDVLKAPKAVIVSTGDELVGVDQKPSFGQIRNSNGPMLWALCQELGVEAEVFPAVRDNRGEIAEAIDKALESDLVLLSGGVSMGEYDYVYRVLAERGVDLIFHKVAVKPGKPIYVGKKGASMVFGLPGNPVSAFVTFQLFVRPSVRQWMGYDSGSLTRIEATLSKNVKQKPGRTFFKPARALWREDRFEVEPVETKGSADLAGFCNANSLLVIEPDCTFLAQGSRVPVLLLEGWMG